jgi:LPXTG-motif cell wall-anchored protein
MVGYGVGGAALIVAVAWFFAWKRKETKINKN